mgnify:CR=1 FL=1
MALFDRFTKKRCPVVSGKGISQTKPQLAISKYSVFPRYYTIAGITYDIDIPADITNFPRTKALITIDGEEYGLDTILLEHGLQARNQNEDIYCAAIRKVNEYRGHGIIHKSRRELALEYQYRKDKEAAERAEIARKKQCDSFSVDDMRQFSDIPFGWHWVDALSHTDGKAWFMLNLNNQAIAIDYIRQLSTLVEDAHSYIESIDGIHIELCDVDFDYPKPCGYNSFPNTYVECTPYTPTGKISKNPAILHFATSKFVPDETQDLVQIHPAAGDIRILKDGNIGGAVVYFSGGYKFQFRLYGLSLVLYQVNIDANVIFNFDKYKSSF